MQGGLHPRRVVIDTQRQLDRVGHLQIELLDVGFGRADIRGGRDHRAVGAIGVGEADIVDDLESEEHTSELQSLMRTSYAVFCLKNITNIYIEHTPVQTPITNNNSYFQSLTEKIKHQ